MKLSATDIESSNDDRFFSDLDDGEGSEPNNINNPASLNKITDSIEDFCVICIKNKHIRIVKHKAMTLIVRKLEKIQADLWGLHNPLSILGKNYIGLLLDEYTRKLLVLLLRDEDEFFDVFKQ